MDNFLEVLIPIIFAIIYLIGGAFKGKNEDEGKPERPNPSGGGTSTLSDRERQIQEEIRRKIRQNQQGGDTSAADTSPAPSTYDPTRPERGSRRYDPTKPEWMQQDTSEPEPEPEREVVRRTYREPEPEPEAAPTWESSRSAGMLDEIEERQKQIAEIQRKAQEMKDRAARDMRRAKKDKRRERLKNSPYGMPGSRRRLTERGSFRDEVIAGLKNPDEFKRSILTYEILGTPVGERRQGKIGPFWEQ